MCQVFGALAMLARRWMDRSLKRKIQPGNDECIGVIWTSDSLLLNSNPHHAMWPMLRSEGSLRIQSLTFHLIWDRVSASFFLLHMLADLWASRDFPVSASCLFVGELELKLCCSSHLLWGFWGFELSSWCLCEKCFIYWAISLTFNPLF